MDLLKANAESCVFIQFLFSFSFLDEVEKQKIKFQLLFSFHLIG